MIGLFSTTSDLLESYTFCFVGGVASTKYVGVFRATAPQILRAGIGTGKLSQDLTRRG